ncbi:PAC2 family protein [Egibacter rhizosphaerae]|uniref:PAC2 family protein n=1 Tax=Egibacter rhizosphaerae TaxID=1670831 RepID=A0A411YLR3_9ACTN|nr:PAC2 family protein [Egibacter rhizosphaerae]
MVQYAEPAPLLRRPVLVAAFAGWNDAGECATSALETMDREIDARTFAEVDPEEFFDFQVARPTISDGSGGSRRLDWPRNRFAWAALPGTDRDVVLLEGTEPNLRWKTFTNGVLELAERLDVELVVTLGALQVDVPHTRPTPLSGSATDPDLAERIGLRRSGYEGPTGITGVLNHACGQAGLPSVSLWAGVPHYLAGAAYAAGALTLVEAVADLLGAEFPLDDLVHEASAQREEIAGLVDDDDDLARYVSELEERSDGDDAEERDPGELPQPEVSGDELAAEFERYLRDRDS